MIPTSNDSIIRNAMAGRNARKDRDSLSFNLYINKMHVEINETYCPVFSIPSFVKNTYTPGENNYQRAIRGFEFHAYEYMHTLCDTCEDLRTSGSIYSTLYSSPRDYVTKEYVKSQERHGSHFFKTLLLVAVLASDFPEKATINSMNLF